MDELTKRLIADASGGPGETSRLVASAKPPARGALSPSLVDTLARVLAQSDRTIGYTSKALAYSSMFRFLGKRDHANVIRLIKGGFLRLRQVNERPTQGMRAYSDSPYGDRYYVLEAA